jgi:hypothetical protein
MAYKNQKKNKKHIRGLQLRNGRKAKKHQREYNRNHKDDKPLTKDDYLKIMKQQGLI